MAKKPKRSDEGPQIGASARIDVSAAAKYEIRKQISQVVPEDVTRARSGAVLDAISPITEWLAFQGDRMRFEREKFRIQAEASLRSLEREVQTILSEQNPQLAMATNKEVTPILEGVAEEACDSPLIKWWANLLVSVADPKVETRPYFADLTSKIGPLEAELLEQLWPKHLAGIGANAELRLMRSTFSQILRHTLELAFKDEGSRTEDGLASFLSASFVRSCESAGLIVSLLTVPKKEHTVYYGSEFSDGDRVSLDVCRGLGILVDFDVLAGSDRLGAIGRNYSATLTTFTDLGSQFMLATHRAQRATKPN